MAYDLYLRNIKEKYFSFIAKYLNINPNYITTASLFVGIISSIFCYYKYYRAGISLIF
jgi:hypothetical protein